MVRERPIGDLVDLLRQLDEVLVVVVEQVPWADRDGNRVVWRESSGERQGSVASLFEVCDEIRMADVDNGWFVHPQDRDLIDDPFVPHTIAGVGPCAPLGSDGGGSWIVVTDDGRVQRLPAGSIVDGVYAPPPAASVELIAGTLADFLDLLWTRARSAVTG